MDRGADRSVRPRSERLDHDLSKRDRRRIRGQGASHRVGQSDAGVRRTRCATFRHPRVARHAPGQPARIVRLREERARPLSIELAAEGVRYERTYSPSTWTAPSHASLFYGAYLQDTPVDDASERASCRRTKSSFPSSRLQASCAKRAISPRDSPAEDSWRTRGTSGPASKPTLRIHSRPNRPTSATHGVSTAPTSFVAPPSGCTRTADAPFFLFVHTYDVHDRCPIPRFQVQDFLWPGPLSAGRAPTPERLLRPLDRACGPTNGRISRHRR